MTTAPLLCALLAAGDPIFIGVSEAKALIETGASVLDARHDADDPYLPGARELDWLDFRDGMFRTGKLDSDIAEVVERLAALGISTDRPVLIYGDGAKGWGEEGRVWWMLRYLGHRRVYILDGGIGAWVAAGQPTTDEETDADPPPGHFVTALHPELRADHGDVGRAEQQGVILLDVRSAEEYAGATPFSAKRGGHLPGARHLDWKSLIAADGHRLAGATIRSRLAALGVAAETPIITYCTGGVRSAFAQAALLDAGFTRVANYDGGWWDWAARDDLPVEAATR